jgi:peptide deformylase
MVYCLAYMDKSSIITLPHKHLRLRSRKVGIVTQDVLDLAKNMQAALLDWESSRDHEVGVALAAVQVDAMVRVVVVRNNFEDKKDTTFGIFINPEITKYEGKIEEDYEGCLSIKDIYGLVPRHSKVRIKAISPEGTIVRLTAEGFLARVFQHEIDHTNGIVFIDHIKDDPRAFFRLDKKGGLEEISYEDEVKNSRILWQ